MDAETKSYLEELVAAIRARVATLAGPMDRRSAASEGRSGAPGRRSGGLDPTSSCGLDAEVTAYLDGIARRLTADVRRLERRLDYLDQRLTGLDRRVTSVDDRITREAGWSRGSMSRIDRQITDLQHRIEEAEADGSAWGAFEPRLLAPMD